MVRTMSALAALLVLASFSRADTPAPLEAPALAARIDAFLAAKQARDGVQPAPLADDAEFFRRLCLDVIGRIPTVAELKDFLDDTRVDKRARWIDELLDGADYTDLYARHFAVQWRRLLLARVPGYTGLYAPPLEAWLSRQFKANTPYDLLVRALLTQPDAAAFYRAQQNKPEDIAGTSARLFLGVKLECAQCHDDRSGGSWKRTQFWEFAAFFSALPPASPRPGEVVSVTDQPKEPARIRIPDTDTTVNARYLDGSEPRLRPDAQPPTVLAEWLTAADNPWFARAAVNRLWHTCFGSGLIEPVDGLGSADAPASHPELLDELTRQFIAHGFDQKYLLRAMLGSQAYQRTSALTHPSQKDARAFARAVVRGLSAEQVYQSFVTATGYRPAPAASDRHSGPYGSMSLVDELLSRFHDPHEQPTEQQASIQQALFLMNGRLADEATSPARSKTLAAVLNASDARPLARRVEDLYLVVLARRPRPDETERLVRYLEQSSTGEARTQALRAVFWALLNSTEFIVNH